MNLTQAFAEHMQDEGFGVVGEDIFIGEAPSSNQAPDTLWWVIASGGAIQSQSLTGQKTKAYQLDVFYRNRSGQAVYDALHQLEEDLNSPGCVELEGYTVIEINTTTFPIDDDLDQEGRKVGLLQCNIVIYKE